MITRLLCWFGFHSWQRLPNFPFHRFDHWHCPCDARAYRRKGGGPFVIVYGDLPKEIVKANPNPMPAMTREEIRKLRRMADKVERLIERQRRTVPFAAALENYWKNATQQPIRRNYRGL